MGGSLRPPSATTQTLTMTRRRRTSSWKDLLCLPPSRRRWRAPTPRLPVVKPLREQAPHLDALSHHGPVKTRSSPQQRRSVESEGETAARHFVACAVSPPRLLTAPPPDTGCERRSGKTDPLRTGSGVASHSPVSGFVRERRLPLLPRSGFACTAVQWPQVQARPRRMQALKLQLQQRVQLQPQLQRPVAAAVEAPQPCAQRARA